jgi:hypothetical protein
VKILDEVLSKELGRDDRIRRVPGKSVSEAKRLAVDLEPDRDQLLLDLGGLLQLVPGAGRAGSGLMAVSKVPL